MVLVEGTYVYHSGNRLWTIGTYDIGALAISAPFGHMSDTSTCLFVGLVQTGLASEAPICIAGHPTIVRKPIVLDLCVYLL